MAEVVEGTALELGTDVVPADPVPAPPHMTLFATDDPVEVVERATRVANALKSVLVEQKMIARIGGKDHVQVEGWQTLGGMLGVVAVPVWTRRVSDPDGWEARVEARTLDGRVIGAGESQCDRKESRWKTADEHAIRSMAQTRATSKALAAPLRFIVKLAGFSGTPAEEMPPEPSGYGRPEPPKVDKQRTASGSEIRRIYEEAAGLSFLQLLNLIRSVKGAPPENIPEKDAKLKVEGGLINLKAWVVPQVMEKIAETKRARAS